MHNGWGYNKWLQNDAEFRKKVEEKKLEFKDEDILMLFKLEAIVDYKKEYFFEALEFINSFENCNEGLTILKKLPKPKKPDLTPACYKEFRNYMTLRKITL